LLVPGGTVSCDSRLARIYLTMLGLTSSVSAAEQKWAMDSVKLFLEKLMNSMFYLGGGVYPGVLKRYYPDCMLLNTGCTNERDPAKFMECLESKRAWTIDWGVGPQQGQKMLESLPTCS
jgi:hypothetical protein